MKKCLIVNDDGYKAAGIRALCKEFTKHYDVTAVAPAHEQSWMGKSITGHYELTLEKVSYHEFDGYIVDGKPADCTQIGMFSLMDDKPDFVISGINIGANIGHAHILSSGTIGAALEAALQGVPAFASSVWNARAGHQGIDFNDQAAVDLFENAAEITSKIVERVMAAGFPLGVQVIAINLPHDVRPDAPWVITKPHHVPYGKLFVKQQSGKYANEGNAELSSSEELESDLHALTKGYVSIVPLSVELTTDLGREKLADILGIPIHGR